MIKLVLLNAVFATSIPLAKVLIQLSSPFFLSGIRMVVAGIALLIYQYWWSRSKFIFKKEHWLLYAQIILFSIYFKYMFRYWALGYLPAGKTAFLLQGRPFIVALLSYFMFAERLTTKKWIGMLVGFFGLMPLLMTNTKTDIAMGQLFFVSWPELAIFVSVVAHSCGLLATRRLIKELGYTASMINGIRMFGGGLLALATSYALEDSSSAITDMPLFLGYLTALILISNILSHNYCVHLLKYYSATFLSMLDFLKPIFTTTYCWLFLGEIVTWHFYLSGVTVFVALYIFHLDELKDLDTKKEKQKIKPAIKEPINNVILTPGLNIKEKQRDAQ